MARALTLVAALLCLLVTAVGVRAAPDQDAPGRRVALVVGNSNYSVPQLFLSNPKNDAQDVGEALKALGFDVITATDLKLADFDRAVGAFREKANGAEIALFFYAGHAVQSDNVNYFIPTDANITQGLELKRLAMSIRDVQEAMNGTQGVQVMILDACRDNPFSMVRAAATRGMGEPTRGLQPVHLEGSGDAITLYSTLANDVASDGAPGARNSPFSRVLIDMLKRPGEHELQETLLQVMQRVKRDSGGRQSPEFTSHISGRYELDLVNDDLQWQAIRHSLDPKVFRGFAARFPQSVHRADAERFAGLLETQERERREETAAQAAHEAAVRQAREAAERELRACRENGQRLDLLKSGTDQGGLAQLQRDNLCPALQGAIDTALASVVDAKRRESCDRLDGELRDYGAAGNAAGLAAIQPEAAPCPGLGDRIAQALDGIRVAERLRKEQEEQQRLAEQRQREQAVCDDEAGRLKALTTGDGPHRSQDVASFGANAHCPDVRTQALAAADDLRRQEAQAAHDARQRLFCAAEGKTLREAAGNGPRAAIEKLARAHDCETLDVAAALAQYDDLVEKRRQQAICDDEGGRLKGLAGAQSQRRAADVAALAAAARCPAVAAQALSLAEDLRRQDAQAAHEAAQRQACAAENRTLHDAIQNGPRAAIEALGQTHGCETLDVPGALAQFDDLAAKRQQEALKACAESDVAGLGERGDERSLAAVAAKCSSRAGDVAAALAGLKQRRQLADACRSEVDQLQRLVGARQTGGIAALGKKATCPTLDIAGALASVAAANCTSGLKALGVLRDDDEAGLRGYAGDADLCADVRAVAQARLDRIETARGDDAACDARLASASASGDLSTLKGLADDASCVRRRDVIARAIDEAQRKADQAQLAQTACERAVAIIGTMGPNDEPGFRRMATDTSLCPAAHTAALARLDAVQLARRNDADCDAQRAALQARGDTDGLKALQALDLCRRRGDVIAQAVDDLQRKAEQARLAQADCDRAVSAVGTLNDDEANLQGKATDPALCPAARSAAAVRLDGVRIARKADADCDGQRAALQGRGDIEGLKALQGRDACRRRQEVVARAIADEQAKADRMRVAREGCEKGVAVVGEVSADDEAALRRFAGDAGMCDDIRTAARTRLASLVATQGAADRACDAAMVSVKPEDAEGLAALAGDPTCVRRQVAIAAAVRTAQTLRIRAAQSRLAALGCFTATPTGSFDAETGKAVALYRAAKHLDGAAPTTIDAEFARELGTQTGAVCVREAKATEGESPLPPVMSKPIVSPPVSKPVAEPAPRPEPKPRAKAPPRPTTRMARPEPQPRAEPPPRPEPQHRRPQPVFVERQRPQPRAAAPPPPPPVTTEKAAAPHIFY